jgi:chromodomain-helicase-DNA-binding protein 1
MLNRIVFKDNFLFQLCLKDSGFLSSMNWACLVVDEAHRLKNSESILHQTLREVCL